MARAHAHPMDERSYLINGKEFSAHDPALQDALARVYGTPIRPRCLCIDGGVEMYVSRFDEFVIKRMPESGGQHHPACPSYQLPARDSGLGQVLGEAIIEHGPDVVELRLDFPLSRRIGHSSAIEATQSPTDVSVARKQLSLRGLVRYLWERAGTAKYSENGHRQSPLKSSYCLGIGCPFLSAVDGQNECRMSIVFSSANPIRRLTS